MIWRNYVTITLCIGSSSVYCIYFGALWTCFAVITSPNRNLCGWNLEYKWWGTVRTRTRKMEESPQGFHPTVPKRVLFFSVINATRPFGNLSCTDFDHFWNSRRESLSACVHRWKIFRICAQGVFQVPKGPKIWYNRVVCMCVVCRSNGTIPGDRNHLEG